MYKNIERTCLNCNTCFLGSKHRKYCSYICAKQGRESKKILTCEECEKEYVVQSYRQSKFCSRNCKHNNMKSDLISITCSNCDKVFERKDFKVNNIGNNFCSKHCVTDYNSGANHYEWNVNLHDRHFQSQLKKWSVAIKKRDNYTCQECGNTCKENLQAHHIKPKSKFKDLIFNLDNGITLCIDCHAQKHQDDAKTYILIKSFTNNYYDKINKINI